MSIRFRLQRAQVVIKRTDRVFTLSLGVPGLTGSLGRTDSACWPAMEGVAGNFLFDEDVWVEVQSGQWHCSECVRNGKPRSFGSREDVWPDHLFQPLATWINERLACSVMLALFCAEDRGATWAELLPAGATPAHLAETTISIPPDGPA